MKKLLEIKGVQCDNTTCDYEDQSVDFKDYKSYLNKPCPKCGSNLLTKEDLRTVKVLDFLFNNPITVGVDWFLGLFNPKRVSGRIDMNGTGKAKVVVEDEDA